MEKSAKDFARLAVPPTPHSHRPEPAPWADDKNALAQKYVNSVYIAVSAVARRVAQREPRGWINKTTKAGSRYVPLPHDHPALCLFRCVNEFKDWYSTAFHTVASLLVTGDAYWWKARNGLGIVSEVWNLPSQNVFAVPSREAYIGGWLVKGVFTAREQVLETRDVVHFFEPHLDWQLGGSAQYYGKSVLSRGAAMADIEDAMLNRLFHNFKNYAPPGILLETDEQLGGQALSDAYTDIMLQHRYAEQTGAPMIAHSGMKMSEWKGKNDLDFTKGLDLSLQHTLALFGVPSAIVGLVKSFNRANAEAAMYIFAENVVNPMLSHMSQTLTQSFQNEYEDGPIELEVPALDVRDKDLLRRIVETASTTKAITPNEARDLMLDLPPYKSGGDLPMVRGGESLASFGNDERAIKEMAAAGSAGNGRNRAPSRSRSSTAAAGGDDDDEDGAAGGEIETEKIAKAVERLAPADREQVTEWLAIHKSREQSFAADLHAVLQRQQSAILSHLAALGGGQLSPSDADRIFPPGEHDRQLAEVANRHLALSAARGVALAYRRAAKEVARRERRALEGARARLRKAERLLAGADEPSANGNGKPHHHPLATWATLAKAKKPRDIFIKIPQRAFSRIRQSLDDQFSSDYWKATVNASTRENLRGTIERGLRDGMSTADISREIAGDSSGLFSRRRAMTIARSETTSAINSGHFAVNQELASYDDALVAGSEWVAIRDHVTRGAHAAADGQKVKHGELFNVGGEQARYPGDPNLSPGQKINCRCVLISTFLDMGDAPAGAGQLTVAESPDLIVQADRALTEAAESFQSGAGAAAATAKPVRPRKPKAKPPKQRPAAGAPATPARAKERVTVADLAVAPYTHNADLAVETLSRAGIKPQTFAEEVSVGLGYDVRFTEVRGSLAFNKNREAVGKVAEIAVLLRSGDETAAIVTRSLVAMDDGKLVARHDFFEVAKGLHAAGIGKKVLANSMRLYEELGVSRITLTANIDVGSYSWARYGFVPTADAWQSLKVHVASKWRELQIAAQQNRTSFPAHVVDTIERALASNDPRAIWEIADIRDMLGDEKLAFRLLGNANWEGELDLGDATAMARFRSYVQ